MRIRWLAVHQDEVYFRDTAHGFLAWAIASLATAALLTSVIGTIIGASAQVGASAAGGAAATGAAAANSELAKPDTDSTRTGYFMDALFRPPVINAGKDVAGTPLQGSTQSLPEVTRIFMNTVRTGPLPPEDARYVAQVVAQSTGLSQQEAEKRVIDTYSGMQSRFQEAQTAAQDTADKTRKASAYAALWLFVSLLAGAFIASWTAIYGGRHSDI